MHLNNISGALELKQRVEENLNIFIQLLTPRGNLLQGSIQTFLLREKCYKHVYCNFVEFKF